MELGARKEMLEQHEREENEKRIGENNKKKKRKKLWIKSWFWIQIITINWNVWNPLIKRYRPLHNVKQKPACLQQIYLKVNHTERLITEDLKRNAD